MTFLFSGIFILLIALMFFVLHILECVWAYRDSLNRGYSQEFAILVLIGIFFFPLLGLIVYLLIRKN